MAKKNKVKEYEVINDEVVGVEIDEVIEGENEINMIDQFRKEFGCNIYLERTVDRILGDIDKDVITAVKVLKIVNKHHDKNTLLSDIEKIGKDLLKAIKGE